MLYWLTDLLVQYNADFNLFSYLTFRSILAALTSLALSLTIGPWMIRNLQTRQLGQPIRDDGPQSHLSKAGTPTMGGVLILFTMILSVLLWGDLSNAYVWLVVLVAIGFGLIGWLDDYRKLVLKNSRGLPARWKYLAQSVLGLGVAYYLYQNATLAEQTMLLIPFFKGLWLPLGIGFIFWAYLMVVGFSNAVNLTDGLDGLAIMPSVLVASAMGIFAYATGNVVFADYLGIPYIAGAGELAIFCAALAGAGLGFLWFNTYPAQVFMGDIGALSIGAALATVALIVRHELAFILMSGLFVIETVSVIIQVASFKLTGKRVFRMAPIHHHFELKGWPEPRVIVRFWIISVVLVLLSLATLKVR